MVSFKHKGNFHDTMRFFKGMKNALSLRDLDKYGQEGVAALASVTPVDSGLTAAAWYYEIERKEGSITIHFCNANIQNGIPIAVILQYGHGTRNGGWVEGRDYINPAIQPVFDQILKNVWREVIKL